MTLAASLLASQSACLANTTVPRIALVIGNANYEYVGGVPRARNDALDFGSFLQSKLGFDDVRIVLDAHKNDMDAELANLVSRSSIWQASRQTKPIVVVYFSGHGFTEGGKQFLAAVDAGLGGHDPAVNSYAVETVIETLMRDAIIVQLVDACRNELQWKDSELPVANVDFLRGSETASISSSKSLSDAVGVPQPELSMYAERAEYLTGYANRNGQSVDQSVRPTDRNSPYTAALLKNFGRPGRPIFNDFLGVRNDDDLHHIGNIPVEEDGMIGVIYITLTPTILKEADDLWASISTSSDRDTVLDYLIRYRNGQNIIDVMKKLKEIAAGRR
ncbi:MULTISPECIES: caspase family protein [unclassified Mesorhizobium]|uniref:caspase family protein n=1 Tax=unclassified Mesorhizobium TaxID=325217 RepID=UPI00241774AE|nr:MULTISPECIES: caspase family protein [unclassified Mesorhizobium]WFP61459.1 caspase family protein [Mesorhizobium sp. WSM4904]WFP74762.1 caspase family protein [Mesorhizobium sp. WSM4906]